MSITPLHRNTPPAPGSPGEGAGEVTRASSVSTDAALACRVAQGDTRALEELVERYWTPLAAYAGRMLDDQPLGEDVVQRLFGTIWKNRREWAPGSVKAYLFQCTRNLAIDEIRRRDSRQRREADFGVGDRPSVRGPDAVMSSRSRRDAIEAAIQALPERRREAFVLAYLRQLSYQEVSDIMGISTKTVGHHISAALGELRGRLDWMMDAPDHR
ncbi:MAG: sigma-70 family RNA polymerase sigma factor [Dehalococcoidia bacterium]